MIRKFVTVAVVCAMLCAGLFGFAVDPLVESAPAVRKSRDEKAFRSDAIIIRPRPGVSERSLRSLHNSLGATVSTRFPDLGGIEVLELSPGTDVLKAIELYSQNPSILYAEPDYIVSIDQKKEESPEGTILTTGESTAGTQAVNSPSDLVSSLWGMNNTGQTGGRVDADIDAPEAWSLATDASGVIVGVIDTGIDYTHPDLAANMWSNPREIPSNGIDDDSNGYVDDVYGINGITNTGDPRDDHYHGTHVAGTIGAVGNNGFGVVGVAWNVKLMGLKFLNSSGSGSTSDAIKCINYGRLMGAKILSNSWGGGGYSQALFDAISAANQAGIVFVAAAGNNGADNDAGGFYPSNYALPNVIAVASTDANDLKSGFSNYGYKTVKIAAPGSSIYSTYPNNSYSSLSGTSMATPHVSGAMALAAAYRPELSSPTSLINHMVQATDPLTSLAGNTFSGGRLNLNNALTGTLRPIPHLVADRLSAEPGTQFTFTDDSLGSADSKTINYGDGSPAEPISGTASHIYSANGNYTVTLTLTRAGVAYTRSITVVVQPNYTVATDTYNWVDTTGLTSLTLTDDGVSGAITLPFVFPLYGRNYTTVYVGSNGLLTFGSNAGAGVYSNTAIPSSGTPNAAIYPYWDDLNPANGGTVRYGNTPAGFVVSYEGITPFSDSASPLTFQVVINSAGVIRIQYQEVKPSSTYGGGRSATIGIEDASGIVAKQHAYLGSPLISNSSAIRFVQSGAQGPQAPSTLSANASSSSQIDLNWIDNASDETSYEVEVSTNGGTFSSLATLGPNSASYSHSNLSAGVTRYYRVRAVNLIGPSAYSNTASATTQSPPNAPSGLSASVISSSQVNLSWTDNSTNEQSFEVQWSSDNSTFENLAAVGSNVTSFADTGLAPNTLRYYRVRSSNSYGSSAFTTSVGATTLPEAPVAPSSLSATAVSSSQINLVWTDNSNNETGFKVEQQNNQGQFVAIATLASGAQSFSVSGLAASTTYTFRVSSYNSGGSNASSSASASTSAALAPPEAPTGLTATAPSGTTVNLAWNSSAGADSYVVQRLDSKTWRTIATGVIGTAYTDRTVRSRTRYSYRVAAVNAGGSSGYSTSVTITTPR